MAKPIQIYGKEFKSKTVAIEYVQELLRKYNYDAKIEGDGQYLTIGIT